MRRIRSRATLRDDVRWGARWGSKVAVVYCLVGGALWLGRWRGLESSAALELLGLWTAYAFGGVAGGALVGALLPLRESRGGRVLLGIAAGVPVFAGTFTWTNGPPWSWNSDVLIAYGICVMTVGPIVGFRWRSTR